jgi:hypothetical protein
MRGMVLYGLNHYICVIRHEDGKWYKYDDSRSEVLNEDLHAIVVYCVKSYFRPTVIIYEDRGVSAFTTTKTKWTELEEWARKKDKQD